MNCPRENQWDGLAMGLVEDESAAEALLAHARGCQACRELYKAARQAHTDRIRMYEALDRNHDEQREQLMAALADEAPVPPRDGWLGRSRRRLGDLAMSLTNSTTRRAAAILVPAAAVVLAVVFSLGTEKSAFAVAIERMREAETIISRFQMFLSHDAESPMLDGTMYMSESHGMYFEMGIMGMTMKMYHPVDGPIIIDQSGAGMIITMHGDFASLGEMQQQPVPDEFIRKMLEMTGEADRELGVSVVDGHEVIGYEISGEKFGLDVMQSSAVKDEFEEGSVIRVWIDSSSKLPVRMEVTLRLAAFGEMLVVYDQFEWDTPLADDLFVPKPAEDVREIHVQIPPATEETLIGALRFYSDVLDRYPLSMDPTRIGMDIGTALAAKRVTDARALSHAEVPTAPLPEADSSFRDDGDSDEADVLQEIMQDAMNIQMSVLFLQKLSREGAEPEYFGDLVSPDDVDEVLVQWLLEDGSVRVIYGDLSAETIPADSVVAEP